MSLHAIGRFLGRAIGDRLNDAGVIGGALPQSPWDEPIDAEDRAVQLVEAPFENDAEFLVVEKLGQHPVKCDVEPGGRLGILVGGSLSLLSQIAFERSGVLAGERSASEPGNNERLGRVTNVKQLADFAGRDVKGKVALVRRFVPDAPAFTGTEAERRFGDLRFKAWSAREHGAVALIVVAGYVVALQVFRQDADLMSLIDSLRVPR